MNLTPADSSLPTAPAKRAATDRASKKRNPETEAAPVSAGVASVSHLTSTLAEYLTPSELKKVKEAYRFSDEKHLGQMRKSGEPYISHPIAVAEICADWKLDAQAIMAALLHDVMEDQDVKKDELIERFGAPVAALVDGLSKLDKLEFQSQVDVQAENYHKMLLAMARDVRVILVKLADRLHNMRTLGVMSPDKKRRIARETMEVYVPIAHRLGLNNIYRELQDLAFSHIYPVRYKPLAKAVKSARGDRREVVAKIPESGVAAHWLYKNDEGSMSDLQQRTHAWLQSLLDIQNQTGDSAEFLEHVKVDLLPDSVYEFTPRSTIIALPRGATALDFAFTIHTDIGDQAVTAKINHEHAPLRTALRNGDIVEI